MGYHHQFRAKWHDYNDGLYFITICCDKHRHFFGQIANGSMTLSAVGSIVEKCLCAIPEHFPDAEVWNYVVMPNHVHMVLNIRADKRPSDSEPLSNNLGFLKPKEHDNEETSNFHYNTRLSIIINQFKSSVSREARCHNSKFKWQSKFHDHIILGPVAFEKIMNYIYNNVENWTYDRFNENHSDFSEAPWNRNPQ